MSLKQHFKWLLGIWLVFIVLIYAFAGAGIKMTLLSKDPAQTADFPVYIGLISNIGILCWCASATACLLGWSLFRREAGYEEHASFASYLGGMTLFLLVDDLWMFHEIVFPRYLGLPRDALIFLYPVLLFWLLFRYRKLLLAETHYILLLVGVALLGGSAAVDVVFKGTVGIDIEDGMKFFGIVTYTYFCFLTMHRFIGEGRAEKEH